MISSYLAATLEKCFFNVNFYKNFLTVCPTPPEGTYSSVSVTSEDPEVPAIETYWPGTTIKYTCDTGYELKQGSSSTAVCDSEGSWDVTLPPICHPGINSFYKFMLHMLGLFCTRNVDQIFLLVLVLYLNLFLKFYDNQ